MEVEWTRHLEQAEKGIRLLSHLSVCAAYYNVNENRSRAHRSGSSNRVTKPYACALGAINAIKGKSA